MSLSRFVFGQDVEFDLCRKVNQSSALSHFRVDVSALSPNGDLAILRLQNTSPKKARKYF